MPHGHFLRIGQPILWIDDPHNCPDGRDVLTILESTCEALVRRGPDLRFVPALAQSWQVSGDGRTWTFQLVDRPHFSNGEPFDSEAVRYAIERMIRPDKGTSTLGGPAVWRSYLDGVEVKPVGRREINVITPEPLADLLDILANAYVLRPDDPGGEPGQAAEPRYIGAGPYRLVEYEPGSHAIAEANPFYHGVPPRLKRVEWRLIADPTERTEALLRQEIDVAVALTVAESARLDGMAGMRTKACAGTTAVVYLFNLLQPGPLQNVAVRCALNLAVDREAIIRDVLNGAGDPLRGIVSSYHVGFDPSAPPFHYDPSAAKRLLAEAEYPLGPSLTFDTPLEMPDEAPELTAEIARQLAEVDVEVSVNTVTNRREYADRVRRREIGDAVCFDSSPLSLYRVVREKLDDRVKGPWWTGYGNAVVNELVDQARVTIDTTRREHIYHRLLQEIRHDPPWLFLYTNRVLFGASNRVSDWNQAPGGVLLPYRM